ncbi:AraC family transcriptional regulator [Paenibacillus agaridevorans]|uniref:AraC family transcriptional regulator n=1 Tax=Paenibacillus agaridevorans TaxID=171404 RepID=A0A2R5EYJ6_9BACL|nr:AraC family transcriptional regulator [Paenibacillus agaridevorans]GBG11195.1 AraC family transcriptional regulator [Paenibacillus agaridevorans]
MWLAGLKPRKYLSHIFISIALSSILAVVIFSLIIYFNATRIFQEKEYSSSAKSLAQVKYNLNQMDSSIKSLSNYLFLNNEIRAIMYSKEPFGDMVELILNVNRLTGVILSSNNFIDSVSIYNSYINEFFYIGRPLYFEDTVLQETINANQPIPRLKPVFRKIENVGGKPERLENVITYYMYDNTDGHNHVDGSIILNVKYSWFMDNVNMINMTDKSLNDQVFILDDKQRFIDNESSAASDFKSSLKTAYLNHVNHSADGKNQGFFESKLDGTNYFVTYVFADHIGFTLLKIEQSSVVYKHIHTLRTTVIWVTIMFLVLILLASAVVSKSTYRPISNLLKHFISTGGQSANEASLKDEISYIGNSYKQSLTNLEALKQEKDQYRNRMREFWIKKLLIGSYNLSEHEYGELTADKSIMELLDGDIYICVIKIDHYNKFRTTYNDKYRKLLKFAILNISTEMLSGPFAVDGADMDDDNVTLIIGARPDTPDALDTIVDGLKQAQANTRQYYNLSFTASVSEKTTNIIEISKVYNNALAHSVYRFVRGRMSVITQGERNVDDGNPFLFDYPTVLEDKMMEIIKLGKSDDFEANLQKFFHVIEPLEYDHIIISLIRLTDRLKRTLDVVSASKIEPVIFDFSKISRELLELETIEDGYQLIVESVKEIIDKDGDDALQARNSAIITSVTDFIAGNYYEPNLSQDQLAAQMKISSRRLSRIFRDGMQLSIPEYINEVRLNKATEWLEKTELSIHQVISKIGIENETYFYAIFKKKFGVTPREYALQKKMHSGKSAR